MKTFWQKISILSTLLSISVTANATILTFDDLPGDLTDIPEGYGGFGWGHAASMNGHSQLPGTGYDYGTVSPSNVGYNPGGYPMSMWVVGGTFTFHEAYFTAAWDSSTQLRIWGFRNGIEVYYLSVTINNLAPTLVSPNFSGIDSMMLMTGSQFAMDNFSATVVPEPSTMLFLPLILVGLTIAKGTFSKSYAATLRIRMD